MVVVKITAWSVCAIYIGELGNVYANTNELHHDPKSWIKSHHTHNTYCHLYCIKKVLVYWSRSTWTQKSTTKCRSESKDFFYLNIEHLFEQSFPFFKCFIQCPVDILPIVLLTINSPMLTGPYTKMTRKIISVQRILFGNEFTICFCWILPIIFFYVVSDPSRYLSPNPSLMSTLKATEKHKDLMIFYIRLKEIFLRWEF